MCSEISLYSSKDFGKIPWPDTENGRYAKNFITPLLKESTQYYIQNVDSKLYVLIAGDLVLPVTVNEKGYKNSYVVSSLGFIQYTKEEMEKTKIPIVKPLLNVLLSALESLFKLTKMNQVVSVNNWMLSTNLYPKCDPQIFRYIHEFLLRRFPQHSIIFRSLSTTLNNDLQNVLIKNGFTNIVFRQVYLFDPKRWKKLSAKARWNVRNDRKLINKHNYRVLGHNEITEKHTPRIHQLYNLLYLEKYTYLNPQFTPEMIRDAIENKTLTLIAIEKEEVLDGVVGFFQRDGIMTTPLLGYDIYKDQSLGLYRMLTGLIIEYSLEHDILLHHSSGAGHFKRKRGMYADLEYACVFNKHLPFRQRCVVQAMRFLFNQIGKSILKKYKL
jgi:hypothetical protein